MIKSDEELRKAIDDLKVSFKETFIYKLIELTLDKLNNNDWRE